MDNNDLGSTATADTNNPFTSVPIEITVSVGKARPLIRDLVTLSENAVLPLDRSVEDPVDLFIDRRTAQGLADMLCQQVQHVEFCCGESEVRLIQFSGPPCRINPRPKTPRPKTSRPRKSGALGTDLKTVNMRLFSRQQLAR